MRAIVQRVHTAAVTVDDKTVARIQAGLLVYLSVGPGDDQSHCRYMAGKIANLRIFEDERGRMNLSLLEAGGQCMVISNFTLHGDCRKGRRPSFNAASADPARKLYEQTSRMIAEQGVAVQHGVFGAHMEISSVNDGPINILLDSQRLF